jgi:hypothetical protein
MMVSAVKPKEIGQKSDPVPFRAHKSNTVIRQGTQESSQFHEVKKNKISASHGMAMQTSSENYRSFNYVSQEQFAYLQLEVKKAGFFETSVTS